MARNWFDVLSDIGGLYSCIFVLFKVIADQINDKKWTSKQIRSLFINGTGTTRRNSKIKLTVMEMNKKSEEGKG